MKIFRKIAKEDEQEKVVVAAREDEDRGECIPVFKERGKSRVSDKGKAGNAPKHG